MRILGLVLNFIFFFQSVAFAANVKAKKKIFCENKIREISVIDAHIDSIIGDKFRKLEALKNLPKLLDSIKKGIVANGNEDMDQWKLGSIDIPNLNTLLFVSENCKKHRLTNLSIKTKNDEDKIKKACDQDLIAIAKDEKKYTKLIKSNKKLIGDQEKLILQMQAEPEFVALKTLKKHIALDVYKGCELKDKTVQSKIKKAACNNLLDGLPLNEISDFAKGSLDIVNELNKKINKVDLETIQRTCAMLTGSGLATKSGVEKVFKDNKGKQINFHYELDEFTTCHDILTQQKQTVSKSLTIDKKIKKQNEIQKKKDNRKKKWEKYITKNDVYFSPKSTIPYKKNVKYSSKRKIKKKGGNFWKTAGIIGAAVGITGLLGFGLYKAFQPMGQATYVPPTNTYTTPRTFTNYSMSPYQQYKYNQYMMNGYQSSSNWMNSTPANNTTPYTFEFNN